MHIFPFVVRAARPHPVRVERSRDIPPTYVSRLRSIQTGWDVRFEEKLEQGSAPRHPVAVLIAVSDSLATISR